MEYIWSVLNVDIGDHNTYLPKNVPVEGQENCNGIYHYKFGNNGICFCKMEAACNTIAEPLPFNACIALTTRL